jgi:hypothetical protein
MDSESYIYLSEGKWESALQQGDTTSTRGKSRRDIFGIAAISFYGKHPKSGFYLR